MPKIVDHDKYRAELVEKAVLVFSRHGYAGLGMRKIAETLGVSKSALYHYFPSKEALFLACTEFVTRVETEDLPAPDCSSLEERVRGLCGAFRAREEIFGGELSLLVDYLRGKDPSFASGDASMVLANTRVRALVSAWVGEEDCEQVACFLTGVLLQRFLDGQTTSWEGAEAWLLQKLA